MAASASSAATVEEYVQSYPARSTRRNRPVGCLLGDRDAPHAQQGALHGRPDGAGVGGVVAEVGALVDARHDDTHVGSNVAHQCDADAVDGRAVAGVDRVVIVVVDLVDTDGLAEGGRPATLRYAGPF